MSAGPILLLDNVSRVHGSGETAVRALDGVSLTVHAGELVAVMGPITWPLTTQGWDPVTEQQLIQSPTIVIPWLHLVAVCVGVPLLASGLAWLAVRRHPQMTRRLV